jgi:ketosteroid isomerase-like protein
VAEQTNEEVVHAYLRALTANDADELGRLREPDWRLDYPQSGERIRGHVNERAIADNYPGGLPDVDAGRVVGSEDRWVVTPSFTFERIAGSGDTWWSEGTARYPDASVWHMVSLYRLRAGRIHRETTYWAEPFDPPAWRAAWVEPIEPD